jgi:hypothetical protein
MKAPAMHDLTDLMRARRDWVARPEECKMKSPIHLVPASIGMAGAIHGNSYA